jgi:uncharacterized OB-fold protein
MNLTPSIEPIINDQNAPFWEGALNGKLIMPWCQATEQFFWPPSPVSPFSMNAALAWKEAAPQGTLVAAVIYRRSYLKELEVIMPYAVGILALDCGPRLQVHLRDLELAVQTQPRVELYFDSLLPDGRPVPMARALPQST